MWAPSLTRGRVCCLQLLLVLASAVILGSEFRGSHDHILLSHIRDSPNLEGQVPVFTPPSYSPGSGFRFRRLLRLTGLRWNYSKQCEVVSCQRSVFLIFIFCSYTLREQPSVPTLDPVWISWRQKYLPGIKPGFLGHPAHNLWLACPFGPRDTASGRTQQKTPLPIFPLLSHDVTTRQTHWEHRFQRHFHWLRCMAWRDVFHCSVTIYCAIT
jgi:hypothetical protein